MRRTREPRPGLRMTLVKGGRDYPVKVLEIHDDGRVRVQYVMRYRTDLRGTYRRRDLY
jgi:hypothetical protein